MSGQRKERSGDSRKRGGLVCFVGHLEGVDQTVRDEDMPHFDGWYG